MRSFSREPAELPPCRNKAMDLLARRPHFRRELEAKLLKRGYEDDEVVPVLDRLEEERYLDDRQTAETFVEARLRREPVGRRKLLADLLRRGAPEELAREAVDAALPEDDRELARRAAERWHARQHGEPKREALARHLERKGFSRRAIVTALNRMAETV